MTEDLKKLADSLKAAGRKDLTRHLNKGINRSVLPLKKELRESAIRTLPRKGGLNRSIADSRFSVKKLSHGISLVARNQYSLEKMDNPGVVRHPTFIGRSRVERVLGLKRKSALGSTRRKKWKWVDQKIKPGWFTDPAEAARPMVTQNLRTELDTFVRNMKAGN